MISFLFLWIILFFISQELFGLGLTANLGEIVLTDLKIGTTTAIQPLVVTNTGTQPVTIKIKVIKPRPEQLEPNYEPIPETSWIELDKDYFLDVQPGSSTQTNVTVSIPNSDLYLGKKYQVYLWSYTEAVGQTAIAAGINSRLLLNISDHDLQIKQPKPPEGIFVLVERLKDKSNFGKEHWDIEKEITTDLKEKLHQEFTIINTIDKKLKNKTYIIKGEITKFELGSREFSALPLAYYREYSAEIEIELKLVSPDGKQEKISSGDKHSYKKIRTIIPGPTEEELIDDKITDFETREDIKWGSKEFRKSVLGKVYDKVIKDLVSQIKLRVRK